MQNLPVIFLRNSNKIGIYSSLSNLTALRGENTKTYVTCNNIIQNVLIIFCGKESADKPKNLENAVNRQFFKFQNVCIGRNQPREGNQDT